MPKRIQRQRTKGWRMPDGAVYVGRPGRFGNPFKVGAIDGPTGRVITPQMAKDLYEFVWRQTAFQPVLRPWLKKLRGKDLACWCPLDQPCHADILLDIANT